MEYLITLLFIYFIILTGKLYKEGEQQKLLLLVASILI